MPRNYKVYLSGPMEFAADGGVGWRSVAEAFLLSQGLEVFNPVNSSQEILDKWNISSVAEYNELKVSDPTLFCKVTHDLIEIDLLHIRQSDFVFVKLDATGSGGTSGELTMAHTLGKSIFGVVDRTNLKKVSGWALSCIDAVSWYDETNFDTTLQSALEEMIDLIRVVEGVFGGDPINE